MNLTDEIRTRYSRYVFWGHLGTGADFTHIYRAWSKTLERLGAEVVWVHDDPASVPAVTPGSWVTAMDTAAKHLPVIPGVDYVLHNFSLADRVEPGHHLNIQVYTDAVVLEGNPQPFGRLSFFDRDARLLVEPWGCDLMRHEFLPPVWPEASRTVYWVGSIWNNEADQGNEDAIEAMRQHLTSVGLTFVQRRCDTDEENAELVRASRIAPAIAGRWQARVNYLPCRVFKNIAYGQLGITNVRAFGWILGNGIVKPSPPADRDSIAALLDVALSMSRREWMERVTWQQDSIAGFDYASKTARTFRAFDELR